jgi:NADH-quinone oxidoreductase subunit J
VFGTWVVAPAEPEAALRIPPPAETTNTHALGQILYTDYFYLFQAAGLVLLIAMVGAIVLTLRRRDGVRRQSIARQVGLRPDQAIEIRKVPTGSGA